MIAVKPTHPRLEAVQRLIQELDLYQSSLYPAESNHFDSIETLELPSVYFVGAFDGDDLVGCGAVKQMPGGYGEIKRMYVAPEARGQGVGKLILRALEDFLVQAGISIARLETGIYQDAAIQLYTKLGYQPIPPFGDYQPDPLSIFMEKRFDA